jgi:hypothetical protein
MPYKALSILAVKLKRLSNIYLNSQEVRPLATDLEKCDWLIKQIKNTVVIACKIAIMQKSNVCFSHLQQIVNTSKEFISEFNRPDHVSSCFL